MSCSRIRAVTVFVSAMVAFACLSCRTGGDHDGGSLHTHAALDSVKSLWDRYTRAGKYDSLILKMRPYFTEAYQREDTLSVIYSGVFMAQAYLFVEDMDSLGYYLDKIAPYGESVDIPKIGTILCNIRGIYAMKAELNYPKALSHFQKGYEYAEKGVSTDDKIVMLNNIVNIFYLRRDNSGMEYARRAVELSKQEDAADYPRCMAALSMARMLQLTGADREALSYVESAEMLAKSHGYSALSALILLAYADTYNDCKEYKMAQRYYSEALDHIDISEPAIISMIYLHYGKFMRTMGNYQRAFSLFEEGLAASYRYRNNEFRREFLAELSDLSYEIGDRENSLEYYREYRTYLDSVSNLVREHEFDSLLLANQRIEYENKVYLKEIDLMRANRKAEITYFIIVVILLLLLFLIILYTKSQKANKRLVAQYEQYLRRREFDERSEKGHCDKAEENGKGDAAREELYYRIEKMMREEKVYRKRDISLEMLSDLLETNRTYVSDAINTFAGVSFPNYINMYRIREAVRLISQPENKILIKQLADQMGYNSVTVFSTAFQRETGCTPTQYRRQLSSVKKEQES